MWSQHLPVSLVNELPTACGFLLTADVNHSGDALVSSDFAEQSESSPEGSVVLPRDADNDGRRCRREILD